MRAAIPAILLICTGLLFVACTETPSPGNKLPAIGKDTARKPRIGDIRDEHGCLSSGGYVWSAAKDSCIRLWESGAVLEPTDRSEMIVYAVESGDRMKAEIFIPDDSAVMLNGDGKGTYRNDSLTLTSSDGKYALHRGGEIIYQTGVPEEMKEPTPKKGKKRRR